MAWPVMPQLELLALGAAAVITSVLLLVVVERINRPLTAIWLKWALTGATVWHVSSFFHALLRDTQGATAGWLDALCMTAMSTGLLLLNCGMLHGGLRIHRSGTTAHPQTDYRYLLAYLPLVVVVALATTIGRSGHRDFLAATAWFHGPYLLWLVAANTTSSVLFLWNRSRFGSEETASRFVVRFSAGMVSVTVLVLIYVLFAPHTRLEPIMRVLAATSPLLPTLIFAYYVFRRRLIPMVFERTLAYGAILLAVVYLHRLTISPVMRTFSEEFQFDFVVVEGLLLVALVLAYHPLRHRVREGLLYFASGEVTQIRDANRSLSVELSRRSTSNIPEICDWFVRQLQSAHRLNSVTLNLISPVQIQQSSQGDKGNNDTCKLTQQLLNSDHNTDHRWVDRSRCHNQSLLTAMRHLDLIAALPFRYHDIHGALLLGMPHSGDRIPEEQLSAIAMLTDQFAATIHNRQLELARQSAERHAIQQEKLSVLGLLSGSLAHELRNPLSSIRTIASLLKEDVGAASPHAKDIDLIVSEIDRLTETTQRLLDFARPSRSTAVGASADSIIRRLLKILGHLARQHSVVINENLQLIDVLIAGTNAQLNDILFNLLKNAIEAAAQSDDRQVQICTTTQTDHAAASGSEGNVPLKDVKPLRAVISITDTGPGIPPEIREQMFRPFVTGKSDGTGLGLYLAKQRVDELGGQLECESEPGITMFRIVLPIWEAPCK